MLNKPVVAQCSRLCSSEKKVVCSNPRTTRKAQSISSMIGLYPATFKKTFWIKMSDKCIKSLIHSSSVSTLYKSGLLPGIKLKQKQQPHPGLDAQDAKLTN